MIRLSFILVLLASAVPAKAHSWYTDLRDSRGRLCCNDRDCQPVGLCVLLDRKEGLMIEGACRPIPWPKVLGVLSPDGGAHACWTHLDGQPNLLCVILPGAT